MGDPFEAEVQFNVRQVTDDDALGIGNAKGEEHLWTPMPEAQEAWHCESEGTIDPKEA